MQLSRYLSTALSLLCCLACTGAQAASPTRDADDSQSAPDVQVTYPQITKLETYILGQTYVADSLQNRLARMEKKAFGAASSEKDLSVRAGALADYAETKLGKRMTDANEDTAAEPDTQPTYPHVTKLETYILGKTYVADSLPDRLARMEKKAFGAVSTEKDLSVRTDALTDYAATKLGKKTPDATEDNQYLNADPPQGGGPADAGDADGAPAKYPHIDALESEILGQTYPQEQLGARISRMETKAFGAPSKEQDFSVRTDALDNYAEKTLHKKSFDKQQAEQAEREGGVPAVGGAGGGSKSKSLLSSIGTQLLSMALPVPLPVLERIANGPSSPANAAAAETSEDPIVSATTPPPAGTRMITQVAWCEMRIFGRTSPQLHLVQRLEQLNGQLNFAPKQTGADLMDDVPQLMKAVVARQTTN